MTTGVDRSWALVALAIALVGAQVMSFGFCLQDDAFLSLRSARNAVAGQGLVFNPGERVESDASFLWTMLCTVPFAAGIDPLLFVRVIGLLSAVGAVLAAGFMARILAPEGPRFGASASVLAAALPSLAGAAAMGVETAAGAGLMALAVALFVREERLAVGKAERPWSGLALALAALARPEGVAAAAVLCLLDAASAWRERRVGARRAGRWALFAVPFGAHQLFRLSYYGDLSPGGHAVGRASGLAGLARSAAGALDYGVAIFPLVLLALVGCWVILHEQRSQHRRGLAVVVGVTGVCVVFAAIAGSDDESVFRSLAPVALFCSGLGGVAVEWLAARRPWAAIGRFGLLTVFAGLLLVLGDAVREVGRLRAEEARFQLAAGEWLRGVFPENTLLAASNAGAVAYASNLPLVDMRGPRQRRGARPPPPGADDARAARGVRDGATVLERRPGLILFQLGRFSQASLDPAQAARPLWPKERELAADERFHREYVFRSTRLAGFYFNYFQQRARP